VPGVDDLGVERLADAIPHSLDDGERVLLKVG
jgi:hypothetical protein